MRRLGSIGTAFAILLCSWTGCDSGSDCTSRAQIYCENGISYWVDSCGEIEAEKSICGCGCKLDHSECNPCDADCAGKCCGDDGAGGECPNTCGQDCNLQTCLCEAPSLDDVFVYFKDSVLQFVIKDGTSSIKTTRMIWTVNGYNPDTKVGTVTRELVPPDIQVPLPATFYFRKAADGGLEYSGDGGSWKELTSPDQPSDVGFLFCTKAAKPASLLGSVSNGVDVATVSYPGGASSGYMVYSEYNAAHNDSYLYSDYGKEYFSRDTGFTRAICATSDHSDYPPYSYRREIDMVSYKIFWPDGTTTEGGEQKPAAPSNLTASYKKNVSSWNPGTGMYENRTYMTLTWSDNSNNETQFNIYLKATDGEWYTIDRFALASGATFSPVYFPPNTYSGSIKAGYYVNWDPGTYYFRLTAASLDLESDPSNEASATAY